jgi:exosortase/archaeosortase family protein
MRTSLSQIGINAITRNLIIPISFALPILMLYFLDAVSFESAWGGRTPHLIFLWLLLLEVALGWKKLLTGSTNWILFGIVAVAPTLYVLGAFLFGLEAYIVQLGELVGVHGKWYLEKSWALGLEYYLFAVFLAVSVWLMYKTNGLKRFSISLFFLAATGFFYMVDAFYPGGTILILQAFAPFVASSAVYVLKWLGYNAQLAPYTYRGMPILLSPGLPPLAIGWPCAGVHSLFIYTFVILLFLKDAPFALREEMIRVTISKSLKSMAGKKRVNFLLERKIIRSALVGAEKFVVTFLRMVPFYIIIGIGALGTFMVNVLRIVTICIIGTNIGREAMDLFHSYFGELFFITWIMIYPLTIIYSRTVWTKVSRFVGKMKTIV